MILDIQLKYLIWKPRYCIYPLACGHRDKRRLPACVCRQTCSLPGRVQTHRYVAYRIVCKHSYVALQIVCKTPACRLPGYVQTSIWLTGLRADTQVCSIPDCANTGVSLIRLRASTQVCHLPGCMQTRHTCMFLTKLYSNTQVCGLHSCLHTHKYVAYQTVCEHIRT